MSRENMERNTEAWLELPAGTTVVVGGHKLTKLASQLNTFGVDEWCAVCQETGVIHHASRFIDFTKEDPWVAVIQFTDLDLDLIRDALLGKIVVVSADKIIRKIESQERRSDEAQGNLGRQV